MSPEADCEIVSLEGDARELRFAVVDLIIISSKRDRAMLIPGISDPRLSLTGTQGALGTYFT